MNEVELSRVVDAILAGNLRRAGVEAILITASGALLTDARDIKDACSNQTRYRVAREEWDLQCTRVLSGYDRILAYFDNFDSDALEKAYETITVGLHEQARLLKHLPPGLTPSTNSSLSFWDEDPERTFEGVMDRLESLLLRQARDPLKRYVSLLCANINQADLAVVEELEQVESEAYLAESKALCDTLNALCHTVSLERRVEMFESIEGFMEDRLELHLELIS